MGSTAIQLAAIAVGAVTNPFVGVLGAIGAALILALVFALATLMFKADFIVVGIGINLLAAGITVLLLTVFYGNAGVTPGNVKAILPKIDLGAFGDIPIIGPMLNDQTILVWLALLLASVGIYGVVSYGVAQRTREIGIRTALGAGPREVLRLVFDQALRLAGVGLIVGAAGAFALTRFLSSLLFQTPALDPPTFGGVGVLITAVVLAACAHPARRALRVSPTIALRSE